MFKHFLITRFNLRKADWNTNKRNEAVLTDAWLENRFKLFENYCFPSVAAQSNKNFEWLVFFDTSTPDHYKRIVEQYANELSNFKPIFIDGMQVFKYTLEDILTSCDTEHVITTALDNDDCMGKYYVEEAQKLFDKQDYLALNFVDGYTLQVTPKVRLGKKVHLFNPFISLIEKRENAKSVYQKEHMAWKREQRLLNIKNIRVWSSIIHSENMINEFTGFGNVNIKAFFNDFKVSQSIEQEIINTIEPVSKWWLTSFLNYFGSYRIVLYKNIKKTLGLYKSK